VFAVAVAIVLILCLVVLSMPLWTRPSESIPVGHDADEDQERVDLEIEKNTVLGSLAELDLDLEQEKFSREDYERLKGVDERRLVGILKRLDELAERKPAPAPEPEAPAAAQKPSAAFQWVTTVVLAVVVGGAAAGIYTFVEREQRSKAATEAMAGNAPGMPNPLEMVARLEKRLKENPDDLEGQIMAGRSYMALQRMDDAKKAWTKVLELNPMQHEAHFNLGVIMLQETPREDRKKLEEILKHFEIALSRMPKEPVLNWYKGVTLVRLKRYEEADESWTTAFQGLTPGSEDAEFVKKALENLRAGNPPAF
jgi:cytochrome c-type biogenesis protein CcmH